MLVSSLVLLLGTISFACSVAAEFKKLKPRDVEVDGSLCSLPRSPAFGLGIAALICLSIAQVVGTSIAATSLRWSRCIDRNKSVSISLLALSWVSFGLAAILLGTGASMNRGQDYGEGWLDRECYVVKRGIFVGASMLAIATVSFLTGLIYSTTITAKMLPRRTSPDLESTIDQQNK